MRTVLLIAAVIVAAFGFLVHPTMAQGASSPASIDETNHAKVAYIKKELGVGDEAARLIVTLFELREGKKGDEQFGKIVDNLSLGMVLVGNAMVELEKLRAELPTGAPGTLVKPEFDARIRLAVSTAMEGSRIFSRASLELGQHRLAEFRAKCGPGKGSLALCVDEADETVTVLGAAQRMMAAASHAVFSSATILVTRGFTN